MCPRCESHLGFPNVRDAATPAERDELERRYQAAHHTARQDNYEPILDAFEAAVRGSRAVICRRWGTITNISESNNDLFKTYYQQVQEGQREPQDTEFDRARQAVDATFFPYFYDIVHFGALSLDGTGPSSYGECAFVLREASIAHRTTVFEENALVFCRKHTIPVGQRTPAGHRALWSDRHQLAAAKLYSKIDAQTTPADFVGILLVQKGSTDTDEFIEAHTYGKLDLTAIERFRAPKPKVADDQVFARRLKRQLQEHGITVESK